MQLGVALYEAGSVRSKNTTNVLLKNLLDMCKYLTNGFTGAISTTTRILHDRIKDYYKVILYIQVHDF